MMKLNKIYFLFICIFSLLLSFIAFTILNSSFLTKQHRNNIIHAQEITKELNDLLSEFQRNVKVIGTLPQSIKTVEGDIPPDNPYILPALQTSKEQLNASIIYLMNKEGRTVACTPYGKNGSKTLTGKNYKFRQYFQKAITGDPEIYLALGVTTNKRGIYYSAPVRKDDQDSIKGVVVIKKSLEQIDDLLLKHKDGIHILASKDGVVFASNNKLCLFRTILPISEKRLKEIRKSKQFANKPLHKGLISCNQAVESIDGVKYDITKLPAVIKDWNVYTLLPQNMGYPYFSIYLTVSVVFILTFILLSYIDSIISKNKLQKKIKAQNIALKDINKELNVEIEKQKKSQKELMVAKEYAEIAVKTKSQFLANMSHEWSIGDGRSAIRNKTR